MVAKHQKATPAQQEPRVNIRFSFEYYDTNKQTYCFCNADKAQVIEIMQRLKEISQKNLFDLQRESKFFHFHAVDWANTTEKNGFPYPEANKLEPFQISLIAVNGQKARMYGGFSKDTFFVVWIDLAHVITPSFKKHT